MTSMTDHIMNKYIKHKKIFRNPFERKSKNVRDVLCVCMSDLLYSFLCTGDCMLMPYFLMEHVTNPDCF